VESKGKQKTVGTWKLIEESIHGHQLPEWFEKQVSHMPGSFSIELNPLEWVIVSEMIIPSKITMKRQHFVRYG
jgi:hypothetical protein